MGAVMKTSMFPRGRSLVLAEAVVLLVSLLGATQADFSDQCPSACRCKWANGKREADCTDAGFNAVPTHLHHEIQILRMSGNYVRKLGQEVFKNAGLLNLQRIFMNNCHVQEINGDAFKHLKILVELNLSHNNITHIEKGTFRGNDRLQTLNLAGNQISTLQSFQFPPLRHLKSVDLSSNFLTSLDRMTFVALGNSVESVSVDHNDLRSLREEVFVPLTNLKSITLHANPWVCDCRLKNFRDWVVDRGLYTYPTACVEPERLADKLWSEVAVEDFACKPEIRVPQSVVFSQPGANVTLGCFISGSPMPEAKWVLKGRIVSNNSVPSGASPLDGQIFHVREEGGLERWFNLTITNVGIEAVADYTCVAVNAGGVMEENISLTFEEPEPVGLPGGTKEESTTDNLGVAIGAAAGGLCFFLLCLLLLLCCCCCRRRGVKHSSSSVVSTPSSGNSRTPERHGSFIGFTDSSSSQRLLQQQQPNGGSGAIIVEDLPPTAHHQRPKAVMVSSSGHSGIAAVPADHYPDLLDTLPSRYVQQQSNGPVSPSPHQPLNPAALNVVPPPEPPAQFPHQFQHLIHSSSSSSSTSSRPPRSHSNEMALLSPPEQFGPSDSMGNERVSMADMAQFLPHDSGQHPSGYSTLPGRRGQQHHRQMQPRGNGQHVDWDSFLISGKRESPIYDGVGPRTSATGASGTPSSEAASTLTSCPTIPEEETAASTMTIPTPPPPVLIAAPMEERRSRTMSRLQSGRSGGNRNSVASDGTGSTTSDISGYFEPFGKAELPVLPPAAPGKGGSRYQRQQMNKCRGPRDSIASAASSDMDGLLAADSSGSCSSSSNGNRTGLGSHKKQKQKQQLRGILKGGSTNPNSRMARSS